MFIRFDTTHERDRRTDGQTDRHRMTTQAALAQHRRAGGDLTSLISSYKCRDRESSNTDICPHGGDKSSPLRRCEDQHASGTTRPKLYVVFRALQVSEIFLPDLTSPVNFNSLPDPTPTATTQPDPTRPAGNGSGRVYPRVRVDQQSSTRLTDGFRGFRKTCGSGSAVRSGSSPHTVPFHGSRNDVRTVNRYRDKMAPGRVLSAELRRIVWRPHPAG